jgi:hypothetical protein
MTELRGGCLCGAVRYEAECDPMMTGHCYCEDCRKSSGTGHCTHVVVPTSAFSLAGEVSAYERAANSGNMVTRNFCPTCGSPVHSTNAAMPGLAFIRASSLADPDAVTPQMAVFASRAPAWGAIDPALPAFPLMAEETAKAVAEQGAASAS